MYDASAILDVATQILGRTGSVADVTMAAVIREANVPSGSVYHRFADRGALLGALYIRAVGRFHAGAYPYFADDPRRAAGLLARYTVEWCAQNPGDAQVLLLGRKQFAPERWSAEQLNAYEAEQSQWDQHLRALIRALRSDSGHKTATLLLLVVDLPYAAVRRYLASGEAVPAYLGSVVEGIVTTSLARVSSEPPDRARLSSEH